MPKDRRPSTPERSDTTIRLARDSRQTLESCRTALEGLDAARKELGLTMYPPRPYTADDVVVLALCGLWADLERESRKLHKIREKRAATAVDPQRGEE